MMNCNKGFFSLILLFFVTKSESSLKLVFSDEFNESSLDENKWHLRNDTTYCDANNHLNCFSSNPEHFHMIDGVMAMNTIRQKYLNKFYTTPYITTKEGFTYGRFEIRAALPRAKMINSAIFLKAKDGWINFMTNNQDQDLVTGLQFVNKERKRFAESFTVEENLNEFNIYVLEWTPTHITWIFNGRTLGTFNETEEIGNNYNPFSNQLTLSLYLAIGGGRGKGEYFPGQTLYEKDADEWNCSLLIIDYIRIYQNITFINGTDTSPMNETSADRQDHSSETDITSSDICSKIMPVIQPKKPSWKLIFSDDFKDEEIDPNKWDIQQKSSDCEDKTKLNCNTNSSGNVRLTDGTLVLAAIREKYSNNNFTAPLISTKRSFKYGKFKIRAALPQGKMLRPYIYLEPTVKQNNDSTVSTEDGKIDILSNTQLQEFYYGIHFEVNNKRRFTGRTAEKTIINGSLFNFHIYVMEWTETEIRWILDNKHLFTASIHKELDNNYNPFDKPFKLVISLGVGEIEYFPGQVLNEEEADKWPCSLLILDYVKVYELSDENIINSTEHTKLSSSDICRKIMPPTWKNFAKDPANLLAIGLASIFSFLLIIVLLNVYLFIRFKKSRETQNIGQNNEKKIELELYDDAGNIDKSDTPQELTYNEYEEIDEQNMKSRIYLVIDQYEKSGTGKNEKCEANYQVMASKNA